MFHQNIGTPVRSSAKYFVIVGLVLLLVGMGYSVYLYKKAISPPVVSGGTASQSVAADVGPQVRWSTVPNERSPRETWPKLNLPEGSKSEFITLPVGMKNIIVEGDEPIVDTVSNHGTVVGYRITNGSKGMKTYGFAFTPN